MKIFLLSLAISVIAVPKLECATAKVGILNTKTWTTTKYDQKSVWAEGKNNTIYGSQISFETKKTKNGEILTRKTCHQLFSVNANGKRKNIGPLGNNTIDQLFAYPSKGYVLVNIIESIEQTETWQTKLLSSVTGEKIASLPSWGPYGDFVPSPTGDLIAIVNVTLTDVSATANVNFFSPRGKKVGNASKVKFTTIPMPTWNSKGEFLMGDGSKTVVVSPTGVAKAAAPKCYSPKTTSTEVNLNGQVLGYGADGKVEVVTTLEKDRIFGCQ